MAEEHRRLGGAEAITPPPPLWCNAAFGAGDELLDSLCFKAAAMDRCVVFQYRGGMGTSPGFHFIALNHLRRRVRDTFADRGVDSGGEPPDAATNSCRGDSQGL